MSFSFATLALLAMVPCLCAQQYPAHWWTPVPEANKPDWEILPQAAKPGEVILSKRNELGILSNFAATPFTLEGRRYTRKVPTTRARSSPVSPGRTLAKRSRR